ncbi:hypothetical protein SAMN05421755_10565 [Nitrosomonas sp. Nm33]|nr:hypothetical protein SAMN05421755_10565 [Nitrosomonas sp. Nm33]
MREMTQYVYGLALIWFIATGSHAESLSTQAFQLKGGQLSYLERNEVYSAWNANDPTAVLKPGMKVMFFGRAEGCNSRAGNGPVKNYGSSQFSQASELTGIPLAREGKGGRWAPSGDTAHCEKSVHAEVADTFVHVNKDPVHGGIGIFTFTGPDQTGHSSFFRPYSKRGKNEKGINASIEGAFVMFRFDWKKENAVRPWATGSEVVDQRKVEFRTVQNVATLSLGEEITTNTSDPMQAKQQLISSFINRSCFLETKKKCQLQYLFNTAVYRNGITNWDSVKWFKEGGVFLDPGQKGMPVVRGPIKRRGETIKDSQSGLTLYSSLGEPTQHMEFRDKVFRMQVSFAQLKNALTIITAKLLRKPPNQISSEDLSSIFGSRWDDPSEWLLLSVGIGQEIHNPDENVRVFLGGGVREIQVHSVIN